jgi:hypothetical protein
MYGELKTIETVNGNDVPGIPVEIRNPHKTAVLRLPTAEEVAAYTASIKTLTYRLGRGISRSETIPNRDAERKLFETIRLDKSGEPFDEYEMQYAINIALFTETDPYEREGDEYVVGVKTPWGRTVHRCRMPLTREISAYREGVIRSREMRHNTEEQRYPPDVPVAFYDAIIVSVEGYSPQINVPVGTTNGASHAFVGDELKAFVSKIPPHHKRQVAAEVSGALYDLDPAIDPNA